jgi:hypothetical protein
MSRRRLQGLRGRREARRDLRAARGARQLGSEVDYLLEGQDEWRECYGKQPGRPDPNGASSTSNYRVALLVTVL